MEPFFNKTETKGFTKFSDACDLFIKRTEKQFKNNDKRVDTLKSYKSFINNIKGYLVEIGQEDIFVIKFTDKPVREFLDVIYYDRGNSARTRNNYLKFIKMLSQWLIRIT